MLLPAPITPAPGAANFQIAITTLDASGAANPGCTVTVFRQGDDSLVAKGVSDGAGSIVFTLPANAGTFYAIAYKAGAPGTEGSTVNTLVAVAR